MYSRQKAGSKLKGKKVIEIKNKQNMNIVNIPDFILCENFILLFEEINCSFVRTIL